MKMCKCVVLLSYVDSAAGFYRRGQHFVTTLADAVRLGPAVKRLEVFDSPDVLPPAPPKAGTASMDEAPNHRMMTRQDRRSREA